MEATLPLSASWTGVTYGNGRFVAVTTFDKAAWSEDGVTWTEVTLLSNYWYSITYGNDRFIAVSGLNKAAWSEDGVTWMEVPLLPSSQYQPMWGSVVYGDP
jgi:hypothetical protein